MSRTAKAHQLPSGSWRIRVSATVDGETTTMSFTDDVKEIAEAKAKLWQNGELQRMKRRIGPPLRQAMEEYIETCEATGRSPATVRGYKAIASSAFKDIQDLPVTSITTRIVQKSINAQLIGGIAPKTMRNRIGFLSIVMKQAGAKLDTSTLRLPEKTDDSEMQILNDTQLAEVLGAAQAKSDSLYLAVLLGAILGMRRSEICALTWADIIFDDTHSYVTVNKAMVQGMEGNIVKKTKTRAGTRVLPLPDSLADILYNYREMPNARVVKSVPAVISREYAALRDKLGVPGRFHDLRHYHASAMLAEDIPQKYIVSDMGHATFDMVRRVYGHVMPEKQATIAEAMNRRATVLLSNCHDFATAKKNLVK